MKTNHPNRIRKQLSNFDGILQKKSGDQHIAPQEETADAPRYAHRINREDMQKITLPEKEEPES